MRQAPAWRGAGPIGLPAWRRSGGLSRPRGL